MRSYRQRPWHIAVVAVLLGLAACGGLGGEEGADGGAASDTTAGDAAGGDRLVMGSSVEPSTLDAHLGESGVNYIETWSVHEALVELGPDGELVPVLAAELPEISEEDPTRWRVELREGISFTNGEPFNAQAVKANVERIQDPAFISLVEVQTLAGAEIIDDYTVDLITDGPDPILDVRLRHLRMVAPEAAQDPDYGQRTAIGTGPMMIERWDRGQRVVLTRNPDYWGEPASLEEVEVRFIPDLSTRVSALQAGEIHIAESIPVDQIDTVPATIKSKSPVEAGIHRFNLYNPPYSDPNFRRALNYAIDKEELNESLYQGVHTVNNCQPVVPQAIGFNPALEPYPYDPDKARELLAQVDLPEGFVLQWEGSVGVYERDRELTLALASYWEEIGLEVNAVVNEVNAYLDKIFNPDPGLIINQTNQSMYHGARQAAFYMDRAGDVSALGDAYPELDPIVQTALTSLDDAEREAAYHELWRVACDESFFAFTLDYYDVWGVSENVQYDPGVGELFRMDFDRVRLTD